MNTVKTKCFKGLKTLLEYIQQRFQELFSGCFWVGLLCYNFFFFRFSVTIFFFLDFSSENFFFSLFFLLESNVMNTVLDPVSICLMERNILVPFYFDIGYFGVSKKKFKIIDIYIFSYNIKLLIQISKSQIKQIIQFFFFDTQIIQLLYNNYCFRILKHKYVIK